MLLRMTMSWWYCIKIMERKLESFLLKEYYSNLQLQLGTALGNVYMKLLSCSQTLSLTLDLHQNVQCSAGSTWGQQSGPSDHSWPSVGAGGGQCWCWGSQGRPACSWRWWPPHCHNWPILCHHTGYQNPSCKTHHEQTASQVVEIYLEYQNIIAWYDNFCFYQW